jgi:hypothetical protein
MTVVEDGCGVVTKTERAPARGTQLNDDEGRMAAIFNANTLRIHLFFAATTTERCT